MGNMHDMFNPAEMTNPQDVPKMNDDEQNLYEALQDVIAQKSLNDEEIVFVLSLLLNHHSPEPLEPYEPDCERMEE